MNDDDDVKEEFVQEDWDKEEGGEDEAKVFSLVLVSFGYKHGVPGSLHTTFNLRKLPNPVATGRQHKKLTGQDPHLQEHLLSLPQVMDFYQRLVSSIHEIVRQATSYKLEREDGNKKIRIGLGCHSGRHRSVAIVETLLREDWAISLNKNCQWESVRVTGEHPHLSIIGFDENNKKKQRNLNRDRKYHTEE
eukprot:TRINITY_DN17802_c0_g1_i1.p1 TRINITY_DN17802_c0_g1~~TRINITY_DN17802_c0_g1_i1.p1  ORF type:complete len:213 (-),score=24.48 TRINITY_DN17802_c0_g1_i1:61-633(-)